MRAVTPEVDLERRPEAYGEEAACFTNGILDDQKVTLKFDVEREDDYYGRLLAYAYLSDGSMFKETLQLRGCVSRGSQVAAWGLGLSED